MIKSLLFGHRPKNVIDAVQSKGNQIEVYAGKMTTVGNGHVGI